MGTSSLSFLTRSKHLFTPNCDWLDFLVMVEEEKKTLRCAPGAWKLLISAHARRHGMIHKYRLGSYSVRLKSESGGGRHWRIGKGLNLWLLLKFRFEKSKNFLGSTKCIVGISWSPIISLNLHFLEYRLLHMCCCSIQLRLLYSFLKISFTRLKVYLKTLPLKINN